ncbi:MAG: F0F1 ATP synthase subunit delta [candidate division Zixibacteria bacterium]|nr:F0F1 ATP synthase subunit delta [candidate division Zixibacteria bacterium]
MIAQEVAQKYANALFMSVRERNIIDQSYEQLTGLAAMLKTDRRLLTFLSSPRIALDGKLEVVRSVFGERLERLLVEFLQLLVRKRRINQLPDVIDEFNRLVELHKGINRVTVITAVPVNPDEESRLQAKLAAKVAGGTIELEKKVDPSLIGGMIVIMHDQIIDGSVRHGMDQLEEQLGQVKVH